MHYSQELLSYFFEASDVLICPDLGDSPQLAEAHGLSIL